MSPASARWKILKAFGTSNFAFTDHGLERIGERMVDMIQIWNAIKYGEVEKDLTEGTTAKFIFKDALHKIVIGYNGVSANAPWCLISAIVLNQPKAKKLKPVKAKKLKTSRDEYREKLANDDRRFGLDLNS